MASVELHELLNRLHAELGRTAALDDESRRLLGLVAEDVRRLGARDEVASEHAPPTPGGLEALAVRFEADHPSAAAALRQVADLLGKAGI
jgi:hypothetical protein